MQLSVNFFLFPLRFLIAGFQQYDPFFPPKFRYFQATLLLSQWPQRKQSRRKRKRTGSSSRVPPPLPDYPEKFITRDAETLYHESLYKKTFVQKRGNPNSNVYFNFVIHEKWWTKFCEHPVLGIAPIIREFHSNLWGQISSMVYV